MLTSFVYARVDYTIVSTPSSKLVIPGSKHQLCHVPTAHTKTL